MAVQKKFALGRGLDALISNEEVKTSGSSSINEIELSKISINPNQPRRDFDPIALQELADSIAEIGIIQPITLRKLNDDDPMNMISGTTGLSGATDSNFVLRKSKRGENTATLYCTGRDIAYRELSLEFNNESHIWNLLSDSCEQTEQPNARIVFLLSALLREQSEISAPAKALLEKIDPDGAEGLTPNSFSHKLRKSVDALRRNGIIVAFRKSNGERLICLKSADGVDDSAAGNTVTIDPAH